MDRIIENQTFDEERALYGSNCVIAKNCRFDGPADGESAFKESSNVVTRDCFFNLRYPFWHNTYLKIQGGEMTDKCRAALWYDDHVEIEGLKMHGIKALRECSNVRIIGSDVISPEFGWSVRNFEMYSTTVVSEYFMMRSEQLHMHNVSLTGKYSFQYVKGALLENCVFDTKDALWHSENVTVRNSVIKGEYLAWYSDHLTLDNCKIIGTQPLCYCKNLRLINCEMIDTDLAFEKSDVEATLTAPIDSIKNPFHGRIRVPAYNELIIDDERAQCEVILTHRAM